MATYDSEIELDLSHAPKGIEDPILFDELLDIHNAIEQLASRQEGCCLKICAEGGEVCLEWGLVQEANTAVLLWEDTSHQITLGMDSNIRGSGVIAVNGEHIYQMDRNTNNEYRYSDLKYSPDFGATWESVTAPYDNYWITYRSTALVNWPTTFGYVSFDIANNGILYVLYTNSTGHTGSVFSCPATINPTGNWTHHTSTDANANYAADRNNSYFGVSQYSLHLHTNTSDFMIGGRASQGEMAIQVGDGAGSDLYPTMPPSSILQNNFLVATDVGGSPYGRSCYQLAQADGTYYITDGLGSIYTLPTDNREGPYGNKAYNGAYWNGASWRPNTLSGSWRTTVSSTALNGGVLSYSDSEGSASFSLGPWANGNGYCVVPLDGYGDYSNSRFAQFVMFSGSIHYHPVAVSLASKIVTDDPDEVASNVHFVGMQYAKEAHRFVLTYGFGNINDVYCRRMYMRVASNPNGPWSDPAYIDFDNYHIDNFQKVGMQVEYSTTRRHFVVSGTFIDLDLYAVLHQRTFSYPDPFICIQSGGIPAIPDEGDILVYNSTEECWQPTAPADEPTIVALQAAIDANTSSLLTKTPLPIPNTEAGATYTLALTDANTVVRFTAVSPTVTIPVEASVNFPIGTILTIRQAATGTLILSTTGLTLNGTVPAWAQDVETSFRKITGDTWDVL